MANLKDKISRLKASSLFRGVTGEHIEKYAAIAEEERHSTGEILIDEQSVGDRVFIIEEGSVHVTRLTSYGEETLLDELGPGDVFGELSAIDGKIRSARVRAATDTLVLSLQGEAFDEILKTDHAVSFNLLQELGSRLRKANDNVVGKLEEQRRSIATTMRRQHMLIEASKNINTTIDLEKLLTLILEAATSSLDADRGTVYLVDDVKKELWSKVLQGENMAEIRLPIGKGIAGVVAETGATVNIPDVYDDDRFNPEFDKKTGYRTRSMLCMPMKNKDEMIIGVFQLINKEEGAFSQDDEEFIAAFSTHASIAVENARMAQEMVANERLSAVGRMASAIIHDIKNPMGTLRVYAQVMKRKSGNEDAAKLADEMIHQVDRFVNMTQEILDFTRGVSSMNIVELDFGEVMESVLNFITSDLEKNNVTLVRKDTFKGKVKMDQDKVIRVFYNIASNARDAMPQGGSLTVATAEQNGNVKIEFTDTGTGMPEEVKKRIFEPFVTHGKKHGTGLGMAIVKKVIDDHKGKIEIDSVEGQGTTIRMFFPTA